VGLGKLGGPGAGNWDKQSEPRPDHRPLERPPLIPYLAGNKVRTPRPRRLKPSDPGNRRLGPTRRAPPRESPVACGTVVFLSVGTAPSPRVQLLGYGVPRTSGQPRRVCPGPWRRLTFFFTTRVAAAVFCAVMVFLSFGPRVFLVTPSPRCRS
jgi:hypothetical protein